MPKVPEYKPQVQSRTVGTNQINVRADANDFGAQVGQQVAALSETSYRLDRERAARAAMDKFREVSENVNRTIQSDYKTRLGKDATGIYDDANSWIQETETIALGELGDDRERHAFKQLFTPTRTATLKDMARHDAEQRYEYGKQIEKGIDRAAQEGIASNYTNPEMVNAYLDSSSISTLANNTDKPSEVIQQMQMEKNTIFLEGAIDQYLSRDKGVEAADFFEQYKDKINPSRHDDILKRINGTSLLQEAQAATDEIIAMGLDDEGALKVAREKYKDKPQVRKMAVEMISARQGESKRIKENRIHEASRDIHTEVLSLQTQEGTVTQQLSLAQKIPDPQTKLAVIKQINIRARGGDVVTDQTVWKGYLDLYTSDKTAFKNAVITRDLDKLSPEDFQEISKWQFDLKNGKGGATDAQLRAAVNDISNRELKGISASDEDKALFVRKVWDTALAEGAATQADIQKIVNDQITDGEIYRKYWFNKDARKYKVEEGDLFLDPNSTKLEDIPKSELNNIIAALKKKNLPIDQESILKYWSLANSDSGE